MSVIKYVNAENTELKFQNKLLNYSVDTGTIDAYRIDLSPVLPEYSEGLTITLKASTNSSGSCTLQIGDLLPTPIKKYGTQDVEANDIKVGQPVTLVYSEGIFHLQTPSSAFVPNASNIVQDDEHMFVSSSSITTWNNKQDPLGYTPENILNKGVAGGYAPLNTENVIPLIYIPPISGVGGTTVHVVSGSVQRLALSGSIPLISGDGCYQYGNGESYIWDGYVWYLTATPEWGNINIDWSNVIGKPTTFTPASHSHSPTEVNLGNVSNITQMPLSYLDIDPLLASNSDIKVPSQRAIKTYVDSMSSVDLSTFNNKILNLEACAQLDMKVPLGSGSYGRVYDILNNTNYYSVGELDSTNTVLTADLNAGQVSASVLSTTGFLVGQEVTIQNIDGIERNIINSIIGSNTIVFSTPVSNSYLSTISKVYRSLVEVDTDLKQLSFPQLFGTITDNYAKIDTPAVPQIIDVQGISFTSDGVYLATGNIEGTAGQNDLYIYKKNSGLDTYSILYIPNNATPVRDLKFDPTDTYLAVAHSGGSPFVKIYKRVGDSFTLLSSPSSQPGDSCWGVSWSGDGVYLAVASSASPYIFIYKRSGDTFTLLSNPNVLPSSTVNTVSFTTDGVYLTIGFNSSPYCIVYKRSGDTFTRLILTPTFAGQSFSFLSPNGTYLFSRIVGFLNCNVYKRSGDDFIYLKQIPTTPVRMSFTNDSKYISMVFIAYPYVSLYRVDSGDTFTALSAPDILPTGQGASTAFSSDGTYLAVGHGNSPYFSAYKKDIGYQDALEIDIRYKITPISRIKEILTYFTKRIVSGFNLAGSISFQEVGGVESYTTLSSGSTPIDSNYQELKIYGSVVESKPEAILKVKATKTEGSLNTVITKLLGMVR
ncbi:MAG: WD40 repeat domain-containing protein [Methanogenium sp.]|jgi:WD40 repeat protein